MTLKNNSYILSENKSDDTVKLVFELSETPSIQWVKCFNNKTETIKASYNSTYLTLEDSAKNISKNTIISIVLSIIKDVDEDIYEGTYKDQILTTSLKTGTIVVCDGLSYSDGSFQKYLDKINNNSAI